MDLNRPGTAAPGTGLKTVTLALALAGLAAATAVVGIYGFGAVGRALLAVRWHGFLLILAWHAAAFVVLGWAWWALVPGGGPLHSFVWARMVRDSAAEVLPLSQIGGYLLGARAAVLSGLPARSAFASTVVDVTVEVIGQIGYTTLGLALLAQLAPGIGLVQPATMGLGVAVMATGGFVAVQRRGLGTLERLGYRLAGRWLADLPAGMPLQDSLHEIYARSGRMGLGIALHLAGWLILAGEFWLALRLLGAPLGFGTVVALDSLVGAIRSVGFAVPNALGVQEGAYLMIGAAFGLTPETALALSLLRRARDVAIGVPTLLAWQAAEAVRARRPAGD